MWSKLYFAALGFAVVVLGFFTWYSWSWLQSIGVPSEAVAGYEYHATLARRTLLVSFVVLLILGNAVLWTSKRAWALWTTLLFSVIFVLLRYFWLTPAYWAFLKRNGFAEDGISAYPLLGVILIVFATVLVFGDQFIVVRLHSKMYPPPIADEPEADTVPDRELK